MLGKPTEDDMSFLGDTNAIDYLKKIPHSQSLVSKQTQLEQMFAKSDPELLKLLKGLLEFNPYLRLTAK